MKLDLHVHSMFSHDCDQAPDVIIRKARRRGLDGLVVTEHNSFEASAPWDEHRDCGLLVLRGVEYSSASGHVLIYGIDSDRHLPEKRRPLREVGEIAEAEGWVLVAAHPFKSGDDSLGASLLDVDAIRIVEINPRCSEAENDAALALAGAHGFNTVGGSDAHFASRVGRVYTEFAAELHSMGELTEQLRSGVYRYRGSQPEP